MEIQHTTESNSDLGELTMIEMDELQVGGSPTAYSYHAKNVDRSSGTPAS
ncbi:hypothetical protein [Streptomyces sp. NPDC002588]